MFTLINNEPIERKCKNCKFASEERPDPKVLQSALFCKYGPPSVILLPTGPGSATTQRTFPVMAPTDWCHRFQAKDAALASTKDRGA